MKLKHQNWKISTCKQLDLESLSLGSWLTMPKKFQGTGADWPCNVSRIYVNSQLSQLKTIRGTCIDTTCTFGGHTGLQILERVQLQWRWQTMSHEPFCDVWEPIQVFEIEADLKLFQQYVNSTTQLNINGARGGTGKPGIPTHIDWGNRWSKNNIQTKLYTSKAVIWARHDLMGGPAPHHLTFKDVKYVSWAFFVVALEKQFWWCWSRQTHFQ